ncbi:hypothetical protein ASE17_05035 [Phenylobacterium sp. Root77]|uniref:S26 family signal peptidase n=1 Tax=unclassified Phenylobacterium TaxID=2640670 RepID=UPI0006F2C735|nr:MULTISPECIES: S26 family signal peptidase [unclassified Phenylobacterium]KQW72234.1 hypothetical protein ASC73_09260 [Phenylobacterium sp. Root1277]KQW95154.1 hypothetical protein ASC79_05405 [Phenylobacterium sp. Root1290]KRC44847.1 hypothetical protein ASE17_05035 [Phenylobacterium sp. Root77]
MIAARLVRRPNAHAACIFALGLGALGLLAAPSSGPPRWVWNATQSAPVGLYRVQPSRPAKVGDWVAVAPPATLAGWLDQRGYLPTGAVLVKQLAAVEPSVACRSGAVVSLDGALVARAQDADQVGQPLPVWRGCRRLVAGEIFVLTAVEGSLDSRYFGPLPANSVVGPARPVWLKGQR